MIVSWLDASRYSTELIRLVFGLKV
jgi:hypothetical protein